MPKRHTGTCEVCKKVYTSTSERFCSMECYTRSKWVDRQCRHCGKEFSARASYVERGQMIYCSSHCAAVASRIHRVVTHNDVRYYKNSHGYYSSEAGKLLHRVIWEEHYGPVPEGCVIHHKDDNKTNNDIDNLELMEWGAHSRLHDIRSPKLPVREKTYCSVDGCERQAKARGLCTKHYQQMRAQERGYWP